MERKWLITVIKRNPFNKNAPIDQFRAIHSHLLPAPPPECFMRKFGTVSSRPWSRTGGKFCVKVYGLETWTLPEYIPIVLNSKRAIYLLYYESWFFFLLLNIIYKFLVNMTGKTFDYNITYANENTLKKMMNR